MAECKWFHKWEKPYFGFRICVKCGRTEERVCYGIDAYWQKQTYDHWLKSMKKDMEEERCDVMVVNNFLERKKG